MSDLKNKRILVLEDEPVAAESLKMMLGKLGCEPVGVVGTLHEALALVAITSRIDAAVLDVNIHGSDSVRTAEALRSRKIPYVLATGYPERAQEGFGGAPVLAKPYDKADLEKALTALLAKPEAA